MNRFAGFLKSHMHKLGYNLAEFALSSGFPFQQLRSVVEGADLPTRQMVQSLAALLSVDVTELAALAAADHAERKYGLIAPEVGQDLELVAVATLWRRLSSPERQIILGTMRDFVERNEQKERPGERT